MELIFPTLEHKQAAWDYRQGHIDRGESWIHGSGGFIQAKDYESWLEKIQADLVRDGNDEHVPATQFFGIVNGKIVSMIQIRHRLNDHLRKHGGHIGYGVRPSERRKGYGAEMLGLALKKCRELGIDKALVTCDKDNVASAKAILKNGGVFEKEFAEDDGHILQHYWITIQTTPALRATPPLEGNFKEVL